MYVIHPNTRCHHQLGMSCCTAGLAIECSHIIIYMIMQASSTKPACTLSHRQPFLTFCTGVCSLRACLPCSILEPWELVLLACPSLASDNCVSWSDTTQPRLQALHVLLDTAMHRKQRIGCFTSPGMLNSLLCSDGGQCAQEEWMVGQESNCDGGQSCH